MFAKGLTSIRLLGAIAALAGLLATTDAFAQGSMAYGTDRGTCDRGMLSNMFSTSTSNLVGSALGAAAGGLLGSQFGKGGGKTAMTIAGVLAGALAGGAVGRSMDPVDQGCIGETLEHTPTNRPSPGTIRIPILATG